MFDEVVENYEKLWGVKRSDWGVEFKLNESFCSLSRHKNGFNVRCKKYNGPNEGERLFKVLVNENKDLRELMENRADFHLQKSIKATEKSLSAKKTQEDDFVY